MAVAFDAVTSAKDTAGPSLTISHACSGSDRVLVVLVANAQTVSVTDVTYNGVSMTNQGTVRSGSSDGNRRVTCFTLVGPSSGTNNVVITCSSTVEVQYGIISFTGANAVQNFSTNGGSGSPATVTVTSATGNMVVDGSTNDTDGARTVGSGQTERWNLDGGKTGGSTEPGAASVTMDWSTVGGKWASAGIDVVSGSQPVASATVFPTLLTLGVG